MKWRGKEASPSLVAAPAGHDLGPGVEAVKDPAEEAEVRVFITTPVGFASRVLGMKLYWWQAKFISLAEFMLLKMVKASLCTPNGSGKSSVCIPAIVLWALSMFSHAKVVITTKDSKQLDNQIWPALTRYKSQFPQWRWIERAIYNEDGGFAIGFTTDEPGRAEGWHKLDNVDGPLIVIADESKSIPDEIFQAIDRCTFSALFLLSSPGLTEGRFWESQGEPDSQNDEANPEAHGYQHLRIGLSDCPHIPQDRIDSVRAQYPADHWFPRSTLDGLFTDSDDDSWFVFSKEAVKRAMEDPTAYVPGRQSAFCDFAAGRNENCLGYRVGNKIEIEPFKESNTMAAIGRFIQMFVKRGLVPSEIEGDEGGMGKVYLDRFAEVEWPIIGVRNDAPAIDETRYENRGAEQWIETAQKVARGELILPNDPIARRQLCMRRLKPASDGRMGVESKEDMKKRLKKKKNPAADTSDSPDRADTIVGVGSKETSAAAVLFDKKGLERLEALARPSRPELGSLELTAPETKFTLEGELKWLKVWERPRAQMRYLAVLNPARIDDPLVDHVFFILRDSYEEERTTKKVPAKLVARITRPWRVDATPLANIVAKVIEWYGRCFCVPIVNDRGDILDALQSAGVSIYSREDFETFHGTRREALRFGWESDEFSRSHWMGALSESIRNDWIDVEDIETVMQLWTLNRNNLEMAKAAEALGVGLKCMNYATTYQPVIRRYFNEDEGPTNVMESMVS